MLFYFFYLPSLLLYNNINTRIQFVICNACGFSFFFAQNVSWMRCLIVMKICATVQRQIIKTESEKKHNSNNNNNRTIPPSTFYCVHAAQWSIVYVMHSVRTPARLPDRRIDHFSRRQFSTFKKNAKPHK